MCQEPTREQRGGQIFNFPEVANLGLVTPLMYFQRGETEAFCLANYSHEFRVPERPIIIQHRYVHTLHIQFTPTHIIGNIVRMNLSNLLVESPRGSSP